MTGVQAIRHVEAALAGLGLRDCYGEPVEAIVASGPVARAYGAEWETLMDGFQAGLITPDAYAAEVVALIERYARARFLSRLDTKLAALKLDQHELSLVPQGRENHG